jgi:hypothetical protein
LRTTLALLLAFAGSSAFADTIVVAPNAEAGSAGNATASPGTDAAEFQEVFGSGQFTGPILITDIFLRTAVNTGPLSFSYSSFDITLSTTQAYPNDTGTHALPSTTYANNVGPDATTVFDGPLSASSPGCTGSGPCPFDIEIALSTPFYFNPTVGRLLMDVVTSVSNGPTMGYFDGEMFSSYTGSTIASVSGPAGSPTGTLSPAGIIVEFDSAPEPASLALLISGIALFTWLRRHPAFTQSRT